MNAQTGWIFWAILSACFAAMMAILAKVGIRGLDSDFATLIRTGIIPRVARRVRLRDRQVAKSLADSCACLVIPGPVRRGYRCIVGVLFPRAAARRRLAGSAGRQAQRRPRCSFRVHISRRTH